MRIISGKLRGHRLKSFKAEHIRPTTDRVKESLFNKLSADIPDSRVLDLFAGTGNLGFEAYSRGASEVVAVEKSQKSNRIIEENRQHLKISSGYSLVRGDVFKYLRSYKGDPFDVIFVDPPFTLKIAHEVMVDLGQSKVISGDTLVMIESGGHESIEDSYGPLQVWDRKIFGDKTVSFYHTPSED